MGLLHEYFAATSDEQAITTVDGGPDPSKFDVVELPDLDPVTMLSPIEALLTGRIEDDVEANGRYGDILAEADASSWVVTVTDELLAAIATRTPKQLTELSNVLTEHEEFADFDAQLIAYHLGDLADLARRATASGARLYCWMSL